MKNPVSALGFVVVLAGCLSFAACGSSDDSAPGSDGGSSSGSVTPGTSSGDPTGNGSSGTASDGGSSGVTSSSGGSSGVTSSSGGTSSGGSSSGGETDAGEADAGGSDGGDVDAGQSAACAELAAAYLAEIKEARACSKISVVTQCVAEREQILGCGCSTFVNDKKVAALDAIAAEFAAANCPGKCPLDACVKYSSGACTGPGVTVKVGTCEDVK